MPNPSLDFEDVQKEYAVADTRSMGKVFEFEASRVKNDNEKYWNSHYKSSTSRKSNPNNPLLITLLSSINFCAVSTPAVGTRYSNRLPLAGNRPSGRGYGNGRYSGSRPSCRRTVA